MDENRYSKPHPTVTRPLLGLTVLAVEDSKYSSDALRLLCLRSGARIRRADCLASARRHLQVYRPSVIIVDMGLPDGSGANLIADLASESPRIDVILGSSGDSFTRDVALAAGADGFLEKPVSSVISFQNTILAALPESKRPTGPFKVSDDPIHPDIVAFQDDMAHAAEVLDDRDDDRSLTYVTQFLGGVARSAGDDALVAVTAQLAEARESGRPINSHLARLAGMVQQRITSSVAV